MESPKWIDDVLLLLPPVETVVCIDNVALEKGTYVATAIMDCPLGSSDRVQIGWVSCCNDAPQDGQEWLIQVLGYDIPSNTWIARALLRESE